VTLALSALWLGVLTSISPCPLATNVAAISFVGRRLGEPRKVLLGGALYTLGRMLAYLGLGSGLVAGLLNAPLVSFWLQKYMNRLLGPVLILVGMCLLGLLTMPAPGGSRIAERVQGRAARSGVWGAGLLGVLFALAFCPVSATLFFGSLIPLAVQADSSLLLPALYGVGTGLPVLVFAVVIGLGVGSVGRVFDRLAQVERWARRLTGVVFVGVGVYFCLAYVFRVL
jgi:cytochrome c-type biogenesis protein